MLSATCLVPAETEAKSRDKDTGRAKRGGLRRLEQAAPGYGCAGLDDPDEIWRVGMEIGKGGEYKESAVCFELYCQMVPDDERGFNILAEVHARMSDYPASLDAAEKAVQHAPDAPESLFLKASALMGMHEYREAREIFAQVLVIDPFHVNSMVNLGSLLGNLNDHAAAVDIYRRVLEIQPALWQARHNLGTSLHSLKRFGEARKLLEEVYRDIPGCFECAMSLANTLRESKDLSSSKAMYEDALAMNSASKEAVLHLYTAMQELVDWDDLDIMFERVVNATRDQLAEGVLSTVNPYHSLLSQFGAPLTLQIAIAHAEHATAKIQSLQLELMPPPLPQGGGARLRVGYIMADWRQHVTAHLLQVCVGCPKVIRILRYHTVKCIVYSHAVCSHTARLCQTVFQRHDATRVEAYAFALNQDDGGAFRRDIRKSFGSGRFVEVFGTSDEEVQICMCIYICI